MIAAASRARRTGRSRSIAARAAITVDPDLAERTREHQVKQSPGWKSPNPNPDGTNGRRHPARPTPKNLSGTPPDRRDYRTGVRMARLGRLAPASGWVALHRSHAGQDDPLNPLHEPLLAPTINAGGKRQLGADLLGGGVVEQQPRGQELVVDCPQDPPPGTGRRNRTRADGSCGRSPERSECPWRIWWTGLAAGIAGHGVPGGRDDGEVPGRADRPWQALRVVM